MKYITTYDYITLEINVNTLIIMYDVVDVSENSKKSKNPGRHIQGFFAQCSCVFNLYTGGDG